MTHLQQTKLSTQRNRIGRGKLIIQIIMSAFVLISAILPFLNNIVGYFMDVNVQLANNAGERRLDLDSAIYFLSIPSCIILLALGGLFKAHRYTFYVVLVSGYFHLVTYIKFIFFNKNIISGYADIAIVVIIALIIYLVYRLDNYYREISVIDQFNNSTLERFSSILFKRNDITKNE